MSSRNWMVGLLVLCLGLWVTAVPVRAQEEPAETEEAVTEAPAGDAGAEPPAEPAVEPPAAPPAKKLTWKERRAARHAKMLKRFDANGDGKLDGSERKKMRKTRMKKGKRRWGMGRKKGRHRFGKGRKKGRHRFGKGRKKGRRRWAKIGKKRRAKRRDFRLRFDLNGDGKLDKAERLHFQGFRKQLAQDAEVKRLRTELGAFRGRRHRRFGKKTPAAAKVGAEARQAKKEARKRAMAALSKHREALLTQYLAGLKR